MTICKRAMNLGFTAAGLLGGLLMVATSAPGATVSFIKIADTNGGFISFRDTPDINNNGVVCFTGLAPSVGTAYFTGSGGAVTKAVPTAGTSPPTINDNGTIAYSNTATGVFAVTAGVTTNIALDSGPLNNFAYPSINNNGTVAFSAANDAGSGGTGWVFTGNGGALTIVANDSGQLLGSVANAPGVNNAGTVAFQSFLRSGGEGVFSGNGGPVTTVADSSGPYASTFSIPEINNAGAVSFSATLKTGITGAFVDIGGVDTLIADNSAGSAYSNIFTTAINDNGTVAFKANLRAGGSGIFLGPDATADKVIATGDPLFGSTLSSFSFYHALNNSNEVAFEYTLANGVSGIAVAVAPEPSTLGVLLPLTLVAVRRRR